MHLCRQERKESCFFTQFDKALLFNWRVLTICFSLYKIISSTNRGGFTFSSPGCMPSVSGSCLISLARTSSTMLNKSGDSGHSCLVLDLREKAFSLSSLSMMLALGFPQIIFIRLRKFLFIPSFLSVYIMTECGILSNAFSASIEMIIFLSFVLWIYIALHWLIFICWTNLASMG